MFDMSIKVPYYAEKGQKRWREVHILSQYTHPENKIADDSAYIELKFNDDLKPHLLAHRAADPPRPQAHRRCERADEPSALLPSLQFRVQTEEARDVRRRGLLIGQLLHHTVIRRRCWRHWRPRHEIRRRLQRQRHIIRELVARVGQREDVVCQCDDDGLGRLGGLWFESHREFKQVRELVPVGIRRGAADAWDQQFRRRQLAGDPVGPFRIHLHGHGSLRRVAIRVGDCKSRMI